jgi:hypothetical protein
MRDDDLDTCGPQVNKQRFNIDEHACGKLEKNVTVSISNCHKLVVPEKLRDPLIKTHFGPGDNAKIHGSFFQYVIQKLNGRPNGLG